MLRKDRAAAAPDGHRGMCTVYDIGRKQRDLQEDFMQTLKGRTCVFAGATAGDGPETAKALCAAGMNVAVLTHQPQAAERLLKELESGNCEGACMVVTGDGGKEKSREESYKDIYERFGSIDVIISNTGGDGMEDSIETLETATLSEYMDHLVGSSFEMLKAGLPYLRKSHAPRVIFMTTADGCMGGTYESMANAVAKGAVKALALNAAARLAGEGITVNCISKGSIPRMDPAPEGSADTAKRLPVIPMGRLGTQADLAGAVCFLASEESSYITGQVLEVNGGLNLGR